MGQLVDILKMAVGRGKGIKGCIKEAESGDAKAQFSLGMFYEHGQFGLQKDAFEAADWYRKAAEQGHAGAQLYLGVFICNQEQNFVEAYYWLNLAKRGNVLDKVAAVDLQTKLMDLMSLEQIAEGERLSREFGQAKVKRSPVNIILANDEDWFLEMIGLAIHTKFKNVIIQTCQDGNQVWQRLLRADPDILITDDKMPGSTGEDLVRRLEETGVSHPIIVTSGWPPTEQWVREYADKNWNITLLRSPFTSEQLYKELSKQLGSKLECRSASEEELFIKEQKQRPVLPKLKDETEIQEPVLMDRDALKSNLKKKYNSVEEVEAEHMVTDSRLGDAPVPFGFSNNEWRELLAMMQKGDELWTFSTSNESWDNMAGRAGVSLVRGGETIYSIVTRMN
jgi:DNA-binding NarL/FixJ family response regulator